MEDIKVVKKITDWNLTGLRTKWQPKSTWGDKVINDTKKLKLTNWNQIIRDRKVWIDLVQNTKTHEG